ncbi:MAG: hypothetical protein WKF58_06050 [Ilumatobacteraceae bacterium]
MGETFVGGQRRLEPLGVQVLDAHVVTAPRQRLDDPITNGSDERRRHRVAIDDEHVHG